MIVVSEEEANRVAGIYGAKHSANQDLDLTPQGMAQLALKLDVYTGAEFSRALGITRRALKAGNSRFLKYPLAWAYLRLERQTALGVIDTDGDDGMAIRFLEVILHLVPRWEHHPLFPQLAGAIVHEFFHTVAMLLAASHIHDLGNSVGFTELISKPGRSPDLFRNVDTETRLSVEIKAPAALQWPNESSRDRSETVVLKHLKAAKKQFTSDFGVVVIGSTQQHASSALLPAIDALVSGSKVPSRIAAVIAVLGADSFELGATEQPLSFSTAATIFSFKNPRFTGANFLEIVHE